MTRGKVVVEGSSVTASQLKDLFRQIEDGSLTGPILQTFLEHRNPFAPHPVTTPVVFTPDLWRRVYDALDLTFDESLWREPKQGFWDVYAQKGVTPNKVVAAMRKLGITVYFYTDDLDKDVSTNDRDPTKGGYRIRFRANKEADEEFKNLSADQLKAKGIKGITLTERLLLGLVYFLATENKGDDLDQRHLDVQNVTYCSGSCDSCGGVPWVRWSPVGRRVYVDWCRPGCRRGRLRCRAAISL